MNGYCEVSTISIIDVTDRCNLNCIYCCRKGNGSNVSLEIPNDVVLDIVKQMIKCRGTFVVIQGGEPMLKKDILELIKAMSGLKEIKPGYFFKRLREVIAEEHKADKFSTIYKRLLIEQNLPLYCITTNGMTYDEEIAKALYLSGFSLEVSLDSPFEATNKITRQGICFKKVTSSIREYSRDIPVEISCTITEDNVDEIHDMMHLAKDLGCICVKYSPVIMIGKRDKDGCLWENRYINSLNNALDKFNNFKNNLYLKIKLNPHLMTGDKAKEVYRRIMDTPNILLEMHECNAFSKVKDIYVDTSLNVYGCASMKNEEKLIIGNLKENTLNEIWNSERRITLKNSIEHFKNISYKYGSCTAAAYAKEAGKEGIDGY